MVKQIKFWIAAFLVGISSSYFSADFTLFINKDSESIISLETSFCSFNPSEEFSTKNLNMSVPIDEIVNIEITNNDSLPHTFTIDGIVDQEIAQGETVNVSFTINTEGTYRYYSSYSYGTLGGASGILLAGFEDNQQFFWNLFDVQHDLTEAIISGDLDEIPLSYQPELFFINGAVYPNTLDDTETYINIQEGDIIVISVLNSGNMDHVMHFHGFHVEIMDASIQSNYTGWIKDTVPFKCGETMTLKLTANQPGIFPIHDHNLIAVTNVGLYPGGMLTHINVSE